MYKQYKYFYVSMLLLALFIALFGCACFAQSIDQQKTVKISDPYMGERHMSDVEVKQRGLELKDSIEMKYQEESRNSVIIDHSIMDEIVKKYIPIGASLADAKEIMASAFGKYSINEGRDLDGKLSPSMPHPYSLETNTVLLKAFVDEDDFSIILLPKIPGDFRSSVGEIQTYFVHTSL
jgi:hypothetical protein